MADSSLNHKSLIVHGPVLEYILEKNAYPREHQQLKELRAVTTEKCGKRAILIDAFKDHECQEDDGNLLRPTPHPQRLFRVVAHGLQPSPTPTPSPTFDGSQHLGSLATGVGRNKIGVFTGYSLLATTLALPDDGQVTAIDLDKEAYETGLPFIQKARVEHKINFIQPDAFSVLDGLINGVSISLTRDNDDEFEQKGYGFPRMIRLQEENSSFDFIFVDAEKEDYMKFHEKVMKLVRIGGIIAYDNTLWLGSVAYGQDDEKYSGMPESIWKSKDFVVQFHELIVSDHRVETCLLSVGDGLTLCRRLY
ncbi:hypothetical protein V6N11_007499 [Hibiscus sabdariffa]|uniref:Caffeoyl-CoA O-methyltransferase n=1 Tax=Hibiscus sabdariffa TaxID=183260 RepID=A0ABR2NS92_9ROSI